MHDLKEKCKAQKRRIECLEDRNSFLELRLRQRIKLTENKYRMHEKDFKKIEKLCLSIFRETPEQMFSYEEFLQAFKNRYPDRPITNLPRRIRQLFYDGHLTRQPNPEDGKQTYALKLVPDLV